MEHPTLGEVVLALHRAEQALTDDGHNTTADTTAATDGTEPTVPTLSPMWAVRYFIAHRACRHLAHRAYGQSAHRACGHTAHRAR